MTTTAARKANGPATFEVDGQTYTLSFDVNRCCDLEAALGKPTGEIFQELGRALSMSTVRALVWAGLRDKDGDRVAEETAGEIIGAVGVAKLAKTAADSIATFLAR